MNSLNLEPLERAIGQLKSGFNQSHADPDNELLRDGVIQRFEYTIDLSWKMIQRYLKHIAQVEESAIRTKKDLFREASRLGLITNVEAWFGYIMRPAMKPPTPTIRKLPKRCSNKPNFSSRTP